MRPQRVGRGQEIGNRGRGTAQRLETPAKRRTLGRGHRLNRVSDRVDASRERHEDRIDPAGGVERSARPLDVGQGIQQHGDARVALQGGGRSQVAIRRRERRAFGTGQQAVELHELGHHGVSRRARLRWRRGGEQGVEEGRVLLAGPPLGAVAVEHPRRRAGRGLGVARLTGQRHRVGAVGSALKEARRRAVGLVRDEDHRQQRSDERTGAGPDDAQRAAERVPRPRRQPLRDRRGGPTRRRLIRDG